MSINEFSGHLPESIARAGLFAELHDDGQKTVELNQAELVLIGLSGSWKSAISKHLAARGFFVANVALVRGVALPRELLELPAGRVFVLHVSAEHLIRMRKIRHAEDIKSGFIDDYVDRDEVRKEVGSVSALREQRPLWNHVIVSGNDSTVIAERVRLRYEEFLLGS